VPKLELLQTLRLVFLAISVKKITTATEIRGDSRAKKDAAKRRSKRFAGNIC